ncbi:MAG: transcription elongation factor subunit Spt4 [Candidatus Pacearchaeota archaeon]
MPKQKACKVCNTIFDGDKCPKCNSKDFTEGFKGRVVVLDPDNSEVAKKLNIKEKGDYAIKTK